MTLPTRVFVVLSLCVATAAQSTLRPPLGPLPGSLVLASSGSVPPVVRGAFAELCGGASARVVVIARRPGTATTKRWAGCGARSVRVLPAAPPGEPETITWLEADGIWFEGGTEKLASHRLVRALVTNVLARGGAIGGQGEHAIGLVGDFGLLPASRIACPGVQANGQPASGDGIVDWRIPRSTALIVHRRRQVCVLGKGPVAVRIAAANGWPERRRSLAPMPGFTVGDPLDHSLDLLSWQRSARERTGPVFPPEKPAKPRLPRGTLVLSGGGGVQSPTWRRFIEAAGGKDAPIVCIPSAAGLEPGKTPSSYSARQLHNHGCTQLEVLHLTDADQANRDTRTKILERAGGVWIDGGRTYNLVDAYLDTQVHNLIREVLARGGAVGGSSAGCQILGDLLVRGDPRTNKTLLFDGYTRGFGLLGGVVLDAHFLERKRHRPFAGLMKRYPQLLGIGVDADTALIVTGTTAEVMGQSAVAFYDPNADLDQPLTLSAGGRYDLVARKEVQ